MDGKTVVLTRRTLAWEIGTGLHISLPPGEYRVTGRKNGMLNLVELDGKYRVLEGNVEQQVRV